MMMFSARVKVPPEMEAPGPVTRVCSFCGFLSNFSIKLSHRPHFYPSGCSSLGEELYEHPDTQNFNANALQKGLGTGEVL